MATLCDNCGSPLVFSPSRNKMVCKMCGSEFRPESVVSADRKIREDVDAKTAASVHGTRDASMYECRIYTCNHCGGDIVINGTEASTVCMYCGNPTVVFKRVSKERRPDGIVPFSISKETAKDLIRHHLSEGKYIPSQIKNLKIEDIRGIYIPYWIVNCDFHDAVIFKGSVKQGKGRRMTYFGRSGDCRFDLLPCDASLRLNDNVAKRLEPFFYEDVRDFDEDYLSGFYSDTSDMSPSDLRAAVLKRCDEMFKAEAIRFVDAKDKEAVKSVPSADIHDDAIYMMFSAWFFTFMYKGKPVTILVNGQTGKTVGMLPVDKLKVAGLSALVFLGLSAVAFFPCLFGYAQLVWWSMYLMMFSLSLASVACTAAAKKIRRLRDNLRDTQSDLTFLYVKKRQEA